MEPGEYAQRGGLMDIFPPGGETPMRLDFFGDELESIRLFDPLTQRTTGTAESFRLGPVSEVTLDQASIDRFRAGYRQAFGAVTGEDPLYHGISAGRRHVGMEHWLPLFHERLESLFDYLPGARISLDPLAEEAVAARLAQIGEHFEARREFVGARGGDREMSETGRNRWAALGVVMAVVLAAAVFYGAIWAVLWLVFG